jgi:two-component system, NarL family, response regulator DevR
MIRLALLDDHPAVLVGLQRVIEQEPDIAIVGAAPTALALAHQLGDRRADVLVVDHDVARSDGLSQCRRIKDRPHPPAVIIYSALASQALALPARVAHADAVVDKAEPVSVLLAAIRSVARGETVLPLVPRAAYDAATARLDGEDLPIFAMLLDGEKAPAIADALRAETDEIAWRAQRIIGRLRPGATSRPGERELESAGGRVPELPFR